MLRIRSNDRGRRLLIGGGSVLLVVAGWQVAGSSNLVSADLISSPSEVLRVGVSMAASGELTEHVLVSLTEFGVGFPAAVAVGVLAGLLMGHCRLVRHLLDPTIMALYSTPRIALIPILVLWFGVGVASKMAVVFLAGLFPVLVNTMTGVRHVDPIWAQAVRSFGASRLQVLVVVTLPAAFPTVLAGIRLGLGRAVTGVIVGEMYVSIAGVGQLIQAYGNAGRTAELMVLVAGIAVFGLVCITGLYRLEDRFRLWPGGHEA